MAPPARARGNGRKPFCCDDRDDARPGKRLATTKWYVRQVWTKDFTPKDAPLSDFEKIATTIPVFRVIAA